MHFILFLILSLAWLANATYIPSLVLFDFMVEYVVEGHTQFTKYATERYPLTPRVAMSAVLGRAIPSDTSLPLFHHALHPFSNIEPGVAG
jgi:predicted membrane-bound dolichyl-phosphate-mannose-protein mannosyltransferase